MSINIILSTDFCERGRRIDFLIVASTYTAWRYYYLSIMLIFFFLLLLFLSPCCCCCLYYDVANNNTTTFFLLSSIIIIIIIIVFLLLRLFLWGQLTTLSHTLRFDLKAKIPSRCKRLRPLGVKLKTKAH